ncbi:MAG: hypothetical protein ACETWM_00500 [Candidatus Lokiarchaeia archaeon]
MQQCSHAQTIVKFLGVHQRNGAAVKGRELPSVVEALSWEGILGTRHNVNARHECAPHQYNHRKRTNEGGYSSY